jgi:UDPglucose--hexose-1-phosphate uridylyltransferase
VVVAPNRRRRPGAELPHQTSGGSGLDRARSLQGRAPGASTGLIGEPDEAELAECPFCAGREQRTPPETLRLGTKSSWTVRVVPNLYPAFERQEVVVHSPRHVRTFAELSDDEIAGIAEAWHYRGEEAWGEGFAYMHVLINEGRAAGSSLPHSHSQPVWLREPPPEVAAEMPRLSGDTCALCAVIGGVSDELVVARREGVVAIAHPAGRLPYELLIAGEQHWEGQPAFDGGVFLVRALELLRECTGRLRAAEGALPWNAWLHNSGHWHIELVPRLSVLAGVELGAGIYVNTVAPEDAAEALREAL